MTIARFPRVAGISLLATILVAISFVSVMPVHAATTADAEFYFANGEVLTGITGGGDFVIPDEFFEDYYSPAPVPFALPITIHVSCSESFPDGWSSGSAFPNPTDHPEWQIASYFIERTLGGGQTRECGETAIPGSISVVKLTAPETESEFTFALSGLIPPAPGTNGTQWGAFAGSALVAGNGGTHQWIGLDAGQYTLSELVAQNPARYEFTSVSCSNGAANLTDASVAFDLHGGEHVVCTFLNESDFEPPPVCPVDGALVIEFGTRPYIRSDLSEVAAIDGPISVSIPAGSYDIWLASYDNHTGKPNQTQPFEQWRLEGIDAPFTSTSIADLPDDQDYLVQRVDEAVSVPALTSVRAYHAAYPNSNTANSVTPLWACLVAVDVPAVDIEKATNGQDADTPTGPQIPVGGDVVWTYVVTNTGETPLSGVQVTDDQGVTVACPADTLAVGEAMTCTASGTAVEGQYSNLGTVDTNEGVSDEDPSHYFGFVPEEPGVDIEKATNGEDADEPTGPEILVGDPVNWTYVVTNMGNIALTGIEVTDDQGVAVSCPQDTLAVAEAMTCTASGEAILGQYANIGTVTTDQEVSDSDPSHYVGYDVADIGDFVWFDADKDGIQDPGEAGVAGIGVSLFEGDECSGEALMATFTDGAGEYLFEGLRAGEYCVGFDLPAEYAFTVANQGTDDGLDSDAPSLDVSLAAGVDDLTVDAGLVGGDIIFTKETDVETEQSFEFVFNQTQEVNLTAGESATFHMPSGVYEITELVIDGWELLEIICDDEEADVNIATGSVTLFVPAGGSVGCTFVNQEIEAPLGIVGDFVWNDFDEDGIQDADEPGIPDVKVELVDALTDLVVLTTSTDANGYYAIGNVPEGWFYLQFTGPAGWEFTLVDQGSDDAVDSDAYFVDEIVLAGGSGAALASAVTSQHVGQTADFYMASGDLLPTWDAGMYFVQVSPTTITTTTLVTTTSIAPTTIATTPETLPFTGFGQAGIGGLALVLLTVGGLALLTVRRRADVTSEDATMVWEG